jgi:transketolase
MAATSDELGALRELARRLRVHALRMCHATNSSHIGSCLSAAEILAVLYGRVLRVDPAAPEDPDRDRFILSKGHAAAIAYAALAERGFIGLDQLATYTRDETHLPGHINAHGVAGVELSTGSLGHGLPVAGGLALASARDGRPGRVFVLVSDGELDEGSNWEAILFAGHHKLANLTVIVDHNHIQSFGRVTEVLDLAPLAAKWRACGWVARELDGHDPAALAAALDGVPLQAGHPSVIIAHTVKGKGVDFMEDKLRWHYSSPNAEQLAEALAQLGATP